MGGRSPLVSSPFPIPLRRREPRLHLGGRHREQMQLLSSSWRRSKRLTSCASPTPSLSCAMSGGACAGRRLHSPAAASGGAGRANRHLLALRRCAHARAAHRAQQGTAGCGEARSRAAENGSFCESSRSQAPILHHNRTTVSSLESFTSYTLPTRDTSTSALSLLYTL